MLIKDEIEQVKLQIINIGKFGIRDIKLEQRLGELVFELKQIEKPHWMVAA